MNLIPFKLEKPPLNTNYLQYLLKKENKIAVLTNIGINANQKEFSNSKYTLKIQIPNDGGGFGYEYVVSNPSFEQLITDGEIVLPCAISQMYDSQQVIVNNEHLLIDDWLEFEKEYLPADCM